VLLVLRLPGRRPAATLLKVLRLLEQHTSGLFFLSVTVDSVPSSMQWTWTSISSMAVSISTQSTPSRRRSAPARTHKTHCGQRPPAVVPLLCPRHKKTDLGQKKKRFCLLFLRVWVLF
jgi:hypothetical protein